MEARLFAPGSIPAIALRPLAVADVPDPTRPVHNPPLEPRDEAAFLLTAAAEIEHALMVQYLYAAYSVRVTGPASAQLTVVRDLLLQVAREEMGHLVTVSNLLDLIGGPVNLGRERSAQAGGIYPFRFTLEPVTNASLAKYVTAESPATLPADLPAEDRALVEAIAAEATAANGGHEVRHVGPVFARLEHLFATDLADSDFRLDPSGRQATDSDWGFDARADTVGESLIVRSFPGTDAAALREAAVGAVRAVGLQGEGFDHGPTGSESHFERFLDIYKRVRDLTTAGTTVTWPVATNPNTTPVPVPGAAAAPEAEAGPGRITERRALGWAHLFNLRYRLLLAQLAHFLRLDGARYVTQEGPQLGDRTPRGLLLIGAFDEMRHLKKIAEKLVQMPKDDPPGPTHAGPPFELPYTLNLPAGEEQAWRAHLDVSRAATRIVREQLQPDDAAPGADDFLTDLVRRDAAAQTLMTSLAEGNGVPAGSLPAGFSKAVTILEEAVRGFSIGVHRNFWADRTRADFVANTQPQPLALNPDGSVNTDPEQSVLVQRLKGTSGRRMPRFRPPVPPERIGFIEAWISAGAPDDPSGAIGVAHERDPAPEAPA